MYQLQLHSKMYHLQQQVSTRHIKRVPTHSSSQYHQKMLSSQHHDLSRTNITRHHVLERIQETFAIRNKIDRRSNRFRPDLSKRTAHKYVFHRSVLETKTER